VLASLLVPDVFAFIAAAPRSSLVWSYIFGVLWGIGGLTFGLTMRYLGIALGMAVALGFCAAFGTLMPPIFDGKFGELLASGSGLTVLAGVLSCLVGIAISARQACPKRRSFPKKKRQLPSRNSNLKKACSLPFLRV
jgi:L-rhamnose-H+ transport protein